jgi:hypothetical protein
MDLSGFTEAVAALASVLASAAQLTVAVARRSHPSPDTPTQGDVPALAE